MPTTSSGELETTTIRLPRTYTGCMAPLLLAEPFLRDEGFTDIQYVTAVGDYPILHQFVDGKIDVGYYFLPQLLYAVDHGLPLSVLGGAHASCWQMMATNDIKTVSDLRGKRIGSSLSKIPSDLDPDFSFLYSVLQEINLDRYSDVTVVALTNGELSANPMGKSVDALFLIPPYSLTVLDTKQGHVLLDSTIDPPWSENFCCSFFASTDFAKRNPEATKRALRAMLRALDSAASDPISAGQTFIDQGWFNTTDYASRSLNATQLDVWQKYHPEDSIRFYALKLHDAGLIRSTPNDLLAKSADLKFFNELQKEGAFVPHFPAATASALWCHYSGHTPEAPTNVDPNDLSSDSNG